MHWNILKWVFHYICDIIDIIIQYENRLKSLELKESLNSDWDECEETQQFTSKYIYKLTNESVFWHFKCQLIIILLFTEVNYIILMKITKKTIWMQSLLMKMQLNNDELKVILINMNNQEAMTLTWNLQFHNQIKHINIQQHFIQHIKFINSIKLIYISTNLMIINSLMKSLSLIKFR